MNRTPLFPTPGARGQRAASRPRLRSTAAALALGLAATGPGRADSIPAQLLDPSLQVAAFLNSGLAQPIAMVYASGQVKRVIGGVLQAAPVLDLAVNSNSERGLLSIALDPDFANTKYVYLRWTQSSTGSDSTAVAQVPLLGNRVDRYVWTGTALTFDRNIVQLRAQQADNVDVAGHPGSANAAARGNHNGGVLRFGPDGKLYLYAGDLGRRGQM